MDMILVRDVHKKFRVYRDKAASIKERVLFIGRNRYEVRWVLKGISFSVGKGEAVGIIGENGSGKSTILKLLTRILYPDQGSVVMKGRVSSLIELGAGFHPDMSGRENIYTNASIFGLSKKEIDARAQSIIAFSELEEFIDNPVRTYSSGMYMRLAFSVAIHVDADILLIDEILAVGDAHYQAKCFQKLHEIKRRGTTVVIVSHALGSIEQICDRSLWIRDGVIWAEGTPREVHPRYLEYMGRDRGQEAAPPAPAAAEEAAPEPDRALEIAPEQEGKRWGSGDARITGIQLLDQHGAARRSFATGEELRIRIAYQTRHMIRRAVLGIGIFRQDGLHCYGTNTRLDRLPQIDLDGSGEAEVTVQNLLLPGTYLLDVAIEQEPAIALDYFREAQRFEVYATQEDAGVCRLPHTWKIGR